MPIYNAPLAAVDHGETRRYAGLRGEGTFPDFLVKQACNDALIMAKPKGSWEIYSYDAATGTIFSQTPVTLKGDKIINHLSQSSEVAVMAVTVGDFEDAITSFFSAGEYTLGLLLDAAATTAVEATADAVNAIITEQAQRRGLMTTFRFSPGYGDWDITAQAEVLKISGGETIDISVNPSSMLIPRKSVTAIIGLQPTGKSTLQNCKSNCESCQQIDCLARKEQLK